MGSLDDRGPHERAWVAAGGLVLTVAALGEPMVLVTDGACCPILLIPAALAGIAGLRDILFGWARSEVGVQRCGAVVADSRLRQLILNRLAEGRTQADAA